MGLSTFDFQAAKSTPLANLDVLPIVSFLKSDFVV